MTTHLNQAPDKNPVVSLSKSKDEEDQLSSYIQSVLNNSPLTRRSSILSE